MSSIYKSAFNDLNGTVSFGGGGGGGGGNSDRANRQAEFARQNSAARNSRDRYEGVTRGDVTNIATGVGIAMGAGGATFGVRAAGGAIATISERNR